jgi:two-component system phosphate regulon sensor histidine kinase PhoR
MVISLWKKKLNSLPWRFFRKLALAHLALTTLIILSVTGLARHFLKTNLTKQSQEQITESLSMVKEIIQGQGLDPLLWCKGLRIHWQTRYTLLNDEGKVLCDNYLEVSHMDNHSDRPEIAEALEKGIGFSKRKSDSQGNEFLYGAIAVVMDKDQNSHPRYIVRAAVPLEKLGQSMQKLDRTIIIVLVPLLLLTSILSLWFGLQISSPIRSLLHKVDKMKDITKDSDISLVPGPEDEWDVVERTLDNAKGSLEKYVEELGTEHGKLSTVVEAISDSILAIASDERVLFANARFRKNFLEDSIASNNLASFRAWELVRQLEVQDAFTRALKGGAQSVQKDMELPLRHSERKGVFDLRVTPMHNAQGLCVGAVGVFHDVTERRLAEQMREDFVANVSHEVRTPLTAMKGYVQILRNTPPENSDQARTYLDKIEQNSDRLASLFQDILQLSVIESKQKVSKETCSTEDITQIALANVRQVYREKGMTLKTEFLTDKVWGNPSLLEQLIANLVENAYKYGKTGGQINIKWSREDGPFDVLEVSDNGPGIAQEHHARIFERFYRVESSRARSEGGTGLGLAIVKHIVQVHSGKIAIHSQAGHGATFTIKFPGHY